MPSRTFCASSRSAADRVLQSRSALSSRHASAVSRTRPSLERISLPRRRGPVDSVPRRGGARRGSITLTLPPHCIRRPECLRGAGAPSTVPPAIEARALPGPPSREGRRELRVSAGSTEIHPKMPSGSPASLAEDSNSPEGEVRGGAALSGVLLAVAHPWDTTLSPPPPWASAASFFLPTYLSSQSLADSLAATFYLHATSRSSHSRRSLSCRFFLCRVALLCLVLRRRLNDDRSAGDPLGSTVELGSVAMAAQMRTQEIKCFAATFRG